MLEYVACCVPRPDLLPELSVAACTGGGLAGRAEQDNVSDVRITAEERSIALLLQWERATSLRGNEAQTAAFEVSAQTKPIGIPFRWQDCLAGDGQLIIQRCRRLFTILKQRTNYRMFCIRSKEYSLVTYRCLDGVLLSQRFFGISTAVPILV
jgi:hypothetical protein